MQTSPWRTRPAGGVRPSRWACTSALFMGVSMGVGCDTSTSAPTAALVVVSPENHLLVGVGASAGYAAEVLDAAGRPIDARDLEWSTADPAVATVDRTGHVTAVAAGHTTVTASSGGVAGSAPLEVYEPPELGTIVPGRSYHGRNGYVEYVAGDLPVVVSAPHGGDLEPDEMPDRMYGVLVRDSRTRETIRAVRDSLAAYGAGHPHIVISHLRRSKLDPNREIVEAAQESPHAEQAWREYHGFVELARERVAAEHGRGLYLDLHGHGHPSHRIELGYLLSGAVLEQSDAALNAGAFGDQSSIRTLASESSVTFAELLRGVTSFGEFLSREAAVSVPSPFIPDPGGEPFFSGGYSTWRHGSLDGGPVDGIQIELHLPGLRDTDDNRRRFAGGLARAVERFLETHYGVTWDAR